MITVPFALIGDFMVYFMGLIYLYVAVGFIALLGWR
jgi:Cu/Ag efflux pump CusA